MTSGKSARPFINGEGNAEGSEMSGQQIVKEAFDLFEKWHEKWAEDLEGVDMVECAIVYDYMNHGIDIDTAKIMAASVVW